MTTVEEATPAEAAAMARTFIQRALDELDGLEESHCASHVRMYLGDALIMLREL